jgi:CRISPR-associated protein Cmr2
MTTYTAISFAPVQGFIEKSRKLRDLFGASLILSYLTYKILKKAKERLGEDCVITPGIPDDMEGMPNRILIEGDWLRDDVEKTLKDAWKFVLDSCKNKIETEFLPPQTQYQWGSEWERWGQYTWELFWGQGSCPQTAMDNLEMHKLKRAWTAINWVGDSSSLTGTDAIAWPLMNSVERKAGQRLTHAEEDLQKLFYGQLSWLFDDPDRRMSEERPSKEQLEKIKTDDTGKFIAANELLSIPELVKRLITYDRLAGEIGIIKLKRKPQDPEFKDIHRDPGYWSGWFMGDGDEIGKKLREILSEQGVQGLQLFSKKLRRWGMNFKQSQASIPNGKGRVVYAGGDDFLGVIYSEETKNKKSPEKIDPIDVRNWLINLPSQWEGLRSDIQQAFNVNMEYSMGFIWAGHKVPQRDILQHCREAEKRAKTQGRNRVTIRVVFNSGQYVQWTCPWKYLKVLEGYSDREGGDNWTHVYNDWAHLKARHSIRFSEVENHPLETDFNLAMALLNLYFDDFGERVDKWEQISGNNTIGSILDWVDGLIQVGWQLCHKNPSII